MDNKKALQKVVKILRDERSKHLGQKTEFPKAMMTGQQAMKGTATVNCGGEWFGNRSKPIAEAVMEDKRFRDFLEAYDGEACIEHNPRFDSYQVRIYF